MIHFCVFYSPAFKPRARICMRSIRDHHPGVEIHGVTIQSEAKPGTYIEGFHKARFQWMRDKLPTLPAGDRLIFVGADCGFYGPATGFLQMVEEKDIVVVPHVITPPKLRGKDMNLTGHANGDIFSFSPEALPVLDWLLEQDMVNDPAKGVFYEQTWLTSLPFVAENVGIYRQPDMNLAWFNFHERSVTEQDGQPYVNGLPLVMAHFTGYVQGSPNRASRYYGGPDVTGPLLKLYEGYEEALTRAEKSSESH